MRLVILATLVACVLACSSSSGSNCAATGTVTITVVDDEAMVDLCGATVTVTPAGGAAMTLSPTSMTPPCTYVTTLPAGTYQFAASATGYAAVQPFPLTLITQSCRVGDQEVSFQMTAAH